MSPPQPPPSSQSPSQGVSRQSPAPEQIWRLVSLPAAAVAVRPPGCYRAAVAVEHWQRRYLHPMAAVAVQHCMD